MQTYTHSFTKFTDPHTAYNTLSSNMSHQRRGEVLQSLPDILVTTAPVLARATATYNWTNPNPTIADFATALSGVNQPLNMLLQRSLWWSLGVLAMLILTIRMIQRSNAHIRHMAAMSAPSQAYWAQNRWEWWKFKKYMLYAPLWSKRHNREFRLSSAMNMGTLPSRFHSILIGLYIASNIGYSLALNYSRENKYSVVAELRGRTGTLAVVNIIALIILAGRNNPLIGLLQISFDTYNLVHRWMGRMVIFLSLAHTLCWAYVKYEATGFRGIFYQLGTDPFAYWGNLCMITMLIIFVTAFSPVRHAFYETFLDIHIIMAILAFLGIYIHCHIAKLPQLPYVQAVIVLWAVERVARVCIILYYNYSRRGWTTATIEALPGEACRVTMHLPRKVKVNPGSHAYIRVASINPWESHPFSIAWVEDRPVLPSLPVYEKRGHAMLRDEKLATEVSFVIQAQTGFTRKLYQKASRCSPRTLRLKAAMEGPYGGHHSLDSYGHAVLFAGASGITHQIPYVRHLIKGFNDRTIATRKILLVWIVRDSDHLVWVKQWMDVVLVMPGRRQCLNIKLFITRPKNVKDIISPSTTVQMLPGRPNVKLILQNEVKQQCGAMCVTVCGPGSLADNIREAVRDEQENGNIDFIEESFTW
jgi:predicted ferric reductase